MRTRELVESVRETWAGGAPSDAYCTASLPAEGETRIGISCSGGGIRSAVYSLGVLQVLRERGELEKADFLAGVSGGGYMVAAHAVTSAHSAPDVFEDLPPWAPGSPEERHLRDHSTYLAAGAQGKAWLALNVVYGLVLNLIPLAAGTVLAGLLLGGAVRHFERHAPAGSFFVPDWVWWTSVALAALALLLTAKRRVAEWFGAGDRVLDRAKRWATRALLLATVWSVTALGVPLLFEWLRESDPLGLPNSWPIRVAGFVVLGVTAVVVLAAFLRRVGPVLHVVAMLAGPLVLLVPSLMVARRAATDGAGFVEWWWPWGCLLVLLVSSLLGNNVRWSMHPFYKERLSTVFFVRRVRRTEPDRLAVEEIPYRDVIPIPFPHETDKTNARIPPIVICAAVNVSDDVVPPGRGAGSFTFTADSSGGPLTGYAPTRELAARAGEGILTLPGAVAIAGAAISPSMGKHTRGWIRFLMALFDVRLGVWLPNPAVLDPMVPAPPRWLRWVQEPGLVYLLREALGRNSLARPYVYVSDGGHWENLGLVELLRRGCNRIYCVDASGDRPGSFGTVGQAVALARSELGVEITIDPIAAGMVPGDDGLARDTTAIGTFTLPNGNPGKLVYVKAAVTPAAPWDARAYQQHDARFPSQGTIDQFFDDQQFESYRALGRAAGRRAADRMLEP